MVRGRETATSRSRGLFAVLLILGAIGLLVTLVAFSSSSGPPAAGSRLRAGGAFGAPAATAPAGNAVNGTVVGGDQSAPGATPDAVASSPTPTASVAVTPPGHKHKHG